MCPWQETTNGGTSGSGKGDLYEESVFRFFFSMFPKVWYVCMFRIVRGGEKVETIQRTPKNDDLTWTFEGVPSEFRYKKKALCRGSRAAPYPPLELCHNARTHKADKGRSQGHSQDMAERRRRNNTFSGPSWPRVHNKVTTLRWPPTNKLWAQWRQ